MRLASLLLMTCACSEYDLAAADKGPEEPTESETFPTQTTTTTEPTTVEQTDPVELCNGKDDDGDGLIDEDYDDTDLDGIADCLDDDCTVDMPGAGAVPTLPECEAYNPAIVKDPWNITLEWNFTAPGQIVVSPVTGQLTDDNLDGVIDDLDIPDVAVTSYSTGRMYIVSGDGTGEICHQDGWDSDGGVIIADVDSDGLNEVVGPITGGQIRAVDGGCNTEWTSPAGSLLYPVTTAADLNADGIVEVISDVSVVNGATGAGLFTLTPQNTALWRTPITGDIDQDGDVEIVLGDSVFDSDGTRLWSVPGSGSSCFGALVDLDTDDHAEIVFSTGNTLMAYEDSGTPIWSQPLAVQNPGPPCAGDIDGDGLVEIVAPNGTSLSAFEDDGTPKWAQTMQDSSGAAGCVVFDMNGDEIYEVLFADETALRVYDGTTGAILWQNSQHDSVTYFETPTVADIDNDGSAEMIVVNSGSGVQGITVFGHNGSGWPTSGPTWGLADFSATNQDPDGSIPQFSTASWLEYNIFRGRPFDDIPGSPNLIVDALDVCVSSCDPAVGMVRVSYQITNDGGVDSVDATVALYLVDPATGDETFWNTDTVLAAVAGEVQAAAVFDVPLADWTGEIVIRVDDDGTLNGVNTECYEDDNESTWAGDLCP